MQKMKKRVTQFKLQYARILRKQACNYTNQYLAKYQQSMKEQSSLWLRSNPAYINSPASSENSLVLVEKTHNKYGATKK